MSVVLDDVEQRVLGCLLEKAVVTPDHYPLTLNSLVNACNQKSARFPVMALEPGQVQRALRSLQDKHVVRTEENFKSQVEKFDHRFCNTPFSDYQFDPAQYAAICVLLLRGPRTPGEIRANSGRLHTFADNDEVVDVLNSLMSLEKGPLVVKLPRTPGRKDSEYQHLLGEDSPRHVAGAEASPATHAAPPATAAVSAGVSSAAVHSPSGPNDHRADLEERLRDLESRVQDLEQQLNDLLN